MYGIDLNCDPRPLGPEKGRVELKLTTKIAWWVRHALFIWFVCCWVILRRLPNEEARIKFAQRGITLFDEQGRRIKK